MRYYGVESDQVMLPSTHNHRGACLHHVVELHEPYITALLSRACACANLEKTPMSEKLSCGAVGAGHHDVSDAVRPPTFLERTV